MAGFGKHRARSVRPVVDDPYAAESNVQEFLCVLVRENGVTRFALTRDVQGSFARWDRDFNFLPVAVFPTVRARFCQLAGVSGLPAEIPTSEAARLLARAPVVGSAVREVTRQVGRLEPGVARRLLGEWSAAVSAA